MADLSELEQQIMNDYGQYITVPLNAAPTLPENRKFPVGTGFNYFSQQQKITDAYNKSLSTLDAMLPKGMDIVDGQLYIYPGSDLYNKYLAEGANSSDLTNELYNTLNSTIPNPFKKNAPFSTFTGMLKKNSPEQLAAQQKRAALNRLLGRPQQYTNNRGFMGIGNTNRTGYSNNAVGIGNFNRNPLAYVYANDAVMGINYPTPKTATNKFSGLGSFVGLRNKQAAPAPTPVTVQKAASLEDAMKAYAAAKGMTLDDVKAKIAAANAVPTLPQTIGDVNAQYYAKPEDAASNAAAVQALTDKYYAKPVQYAQGGRVKTHYADGDLVTVPSANPELNALLQQYNTGADYTSQLSEVRQARMDKEAEFNKSMQALVSGADTGPSKAELYWKLAAAFGTPAGKTGQFGENLASAATQMADYGKEQRLAESAKRKLQTEIGLKQQEYGLESAKDMEKTLLALQSETNKDRREMIKGTIKEYIDSGKPQSEAGRIAKDKGFKVGTPEYQTEVDKQAKLLVEKQMAAINAQLLSGQAQLANIGVQQRKEEREAVKLEPDERKAIRDDEDAIYAAKSAIKNIEEAMSVVDKAFSNNAVDRSKFDTLKISNPNDPRVIATEQLEILLGTNTLANLKSTFSGGNVTDAERNALSALQGLSAASPESRKAILQRAKKSLAEAIENRNNRIYKIETGGYRKKTEGK